MTTDADPLLALDNQLCFAIYAANRAVTARYRPLLAELGLTYPQYLVMLVLWQADRDGERVRVSDIGQRLRLDTGTLTPLLKRLQGAALVERRRDSSDERVVTIALTGRGRELRRRAVAIPEQLMCSSGIDPQRLEALREELRSLLAALDRADGSSVG
ncbi:MarR family winged helix-turn-helix transcriptional regulator [Marinobacter sp. SS21]|uniref:MarR family winged helix-turn-helix transcriptional regulator n=1 Tax=Marinobacter sp. SS21 TaxID=2979460 RepID=UPI00232C9B0F|nr:MarR family transcriptional regulator [Marinobacter sp. SS21]MDC0662041.1 MarR family transcriptional regulator [Marinobacter sp. SS21]